ncbi:MAG: tetratricopeptide repeat protein [Polymorphobacter sp.]|uniref:tetratricopeptide repeat protein n=1 Tax=Polymorphobacter sp. TaxID=1909290 RepID=UPI003A8AA67A
MIYAFTANFIGVMLAAVTIIFTISLIVGFIGKLLNRSQISFCLNSSLIIGLGLSAGSIFLAFNADKIPGDRSASEFVLQSLACLISTWIVILIYKKVILSRDRDDQGPEKLQSKLESSDGEKQQRETRRRAKETETQQNTQNDDNKPQSKERDISKLLLFGSFAIPIFLIIVISLFSEPTSNIAAAVETNGEAFTAYEQKDVAELRGLATEGDAVAQFYLGYMYDTGEGVAQDDAAAVSWYRKSAEQGDVDAQRNLGAMYNIGKGVELDYVAAVDWFRKAAEQGDALSQFLLGASYDMGEGVAQDYTVAVSWYRKAADQGLAEAQFNLGNMYYSGRGLEQDYAAAVSWYRKAADQGLAEAQFNLGASYDMGEGVAQDYVQAHKWLNLAGAGAADTETRNEANELRENVAAKMQPAQIAEAQRLASAWRKK